MTSNSNMDDVERMSQDLAKSGLTFHDMFTRVLDMPERNMANISMNTKGYVIPYYDMYGRLLQHYRIKVFDSEPKYRQVKNTPNHTYFPPTFMDAYRKVRGKLVILTEGEKKAALMCKLGIPCIAFGGADSWANRTILLPKEVEISAYAHNRSYLAAKLPSTTIDENLLQPLAVGFQDLLDVCLKNRTTFYICYDTDGKLGVSPQVQRAAAKLGYELRFKGFQISQIKQIILPYLDSDEDMKVGLDDYLMHDDGGINRFMHILEDVANDPVSFPRHPNLREHINKMLQRPKLDRKQIQNLSLSLITEMDSRGRRMYSSSQSQLYYFDGVSKHLMKVHVNSGDAQGIQETPFGRLLYRDYGVAPAADVRLLQWFGAQFAAEDPIDDVDPHRMFARVKEDEDIVRYQINDGEYVKVDAKGWEILPNGADNVLFESGLVGDLKSKDMKEAFEEQFTGHTPQMWWQEVLDEVRLRDHGQNATIIGLLYYLSPWLNRWRGMQLPVELIVGEAGSGKSTLAEVRLNILAGEARLRNAPSSIKDWNASIANSGGLHVTDNVHLMDKTLKQNMSDELCRLVTDPNPSIEMRKYYTEADIRQIRVSSTFAFTAIQQPFMNADLLQRAVLLELDKNIDDIKAGRFSFDSHWKGYQLEKFGGREAWIAHHIYVIHRFFQLVRKKWNHRYKSKHRLVNFEQSLMLMAEVFGLESAWIPDYLLYMNNSSVGKADWVLEGLIEFADRKRRDKRKDARFTALDIAEWASGEEDFEKNFTLTNSRALGKYLQTNKHNLVTIVGIEEAGKYANRMTYRCMPEPIKLEYKPSEPLVPQKNGN